MIDIRELIAERQRRDPAFRVTRDVRSGQYFVQNQVVFQYPVDKTSEETVKLAQGYIDRINQQRQTAGQPLLRVKITALSKGVVIVNGRGATELIGGGGTTPHPPPPPPPPWRPDDIRLDRVLVIHVLAEINKGRFDILLTSQALAAGISLEVLSVV
ncbi:hypothetical protein [Spirosoma rhododendri]|uniref:Uncharacterized protein n=1 Tax=Spirosoma rhododendri TaxID=2728024 RepID=A0A7L5DLN3_9BACT|nr:hypothetical protein [Spirosoma rhododendri]QJD79326.1 hypothetical protein HH216_13565 [Spirosoma rhododendri]